MSTWTCLPERLGFVVFLKLYLSARKSKFQGIASFPRVQAWKLLTEVLILAVLRVLRERGVFQVLNIDLQSSYQMATFCRSRQAADTWGKKRNIEGSHCERWLFSLVHNCTHDKYICSQREKYTIATRAAAPSPLKQTF